jgi:hypothetical protein
MKKNYFIIDYLVLSLALLASIAIGSTAYASGEPALSKIVFYVA